MMDKYYIQNLDGTLYKKDIPILYFKIDGQQLIEYKKLADKKYLPAHLDGKISYNNIRSFFEDRVVEYGAMWVDDYIHALGLESYNFEEIIKRNNGWNHLDLFWIKLKNIGATSWNEILHQKYPIY